MDAHMNLQRERAANLAYIVANQNDRIDKLEENSGRHSEESHMNNPRIIE